MSLCHSFTTLSIACLVGDTSRCRKEFKGESVKNELSLYQTVALLSVCCRCFERRLVSVPYRL